MDRLTRLARWFGSRPGAQLVVGAIVLMFAFPATAAGTIGRLVAWGALGVGIAVGWPHLPDGVRHPSRRVAIALVLGLVGVVGLAVFWDVIASSPDWQMGDWGPQHAVLARIMPSLPGLDVPVWNHAVSTGDAPLDLYPALTYLFTGHFALAFGLEHDLPHAYMIVATLVHLGLALTTTALAMRIASKPAALAVGMLWLVDSGAISHGGTVGLFHWALLHSAFAHVFSMISALGILAALKRPRLGASVAIWLGTAIATAAHPAALITAAAFALALVAVALLASDVPPRRALVALGHLALGAALGATVWMPGAERLLAYGQHFPNELFSGVKLLQTIMMFAMPITAYSFVVYAGYLGILTGMWVRRAEVVFVAVVGLALMIGLCDAPYLGLGLTPGQTVARLGAIRMMLLVRPFMFAAAAFAFTALAGRAREAWASAPRRSRLVAAAILGVMLGSLCRVVPEYWRGETDRAIEEARQFAPDPGGRQALEAWAAEQMRTIGPGSWARAMFEEDTHEHFHLTATTGLPSFHLSPIPDLLLRERIEDASPESLKRFDVRWAIGVGRSPQLGDPATERILGTYHVREIPGWDGQFARVERGTGTVQTVRLDDRAVEIEVTAPGPVLVVLGTGYYPRWRAHHASGPGVERGGLAPTLGEEEPVYAYPGIKDGGLHVVAAWVAPGRTIFTCDGALPSDGRGRILSVLAALLAAAGVVVWSRSRWRIRALRRLARLHARVPVLVAWGLEVGIPALLVILVVRGCASQTGRTSALLVGSGVRAAATVEARTGGGAWQTCDYAALTGSFRCDGLVTVSDATANVINDAPPSWAFVTPSIDAIADRESVELKITRTAHLSGRYWASTTFGSASVQAGNQPAQEFASHAMLDFDDNGQQQVILGARAPEGAALHLIFVAQDTLVPPRPFLAGPPDAAPAEIAAIH